MRIRETRDVHWLSHWNPTHLRLLCDAAWHPARGPAYLNPRSADGWSYTCDTASVTCPVCLDRLGVTGSDAPEAPVVPSASVIQRAWVSVPPGIPREAIRDCGWTWDGTVMRYHDRTAQGARRTVLTTVAGVPFSRPDEYDTGAPVSAMLSLVEIPVRTMPAAWLRDSAPAPDSDGSR